jgi:hypothetical protein
MTTSQLFTLSLRPFTRAVRRWIINRRIAHIQFQIAHLCQQQANDRHVERVLMGRMAFLRSDLIDL